MKDELFHFSDHSKDRGWKDYCVRAKTTLEENLTQELAFAVREAAYYWCRHNSFTLEDLAKRMRPADFLVFAEFIEAHALTLDETLRAFNVPSRVDAPKPQ